VRDKSQGREISFPTPGERLLHPQMEAVITVLHTPESTWATDEMTINDEIE
jgi:hypothetical protein